MAQAGSKSPSERHTERLVDAGTAFVEKYRFDQNAFWVDVLRVDPDPWQRESNDAVCDYVRYMYQRPVVVQRADDIKNWFTAVAMHGPGKTMWIAGMACWFGSVFPYARIPCVAPKIGQLKTRLWMELRKIRDRAIPEFRLMTRDIGALYMKWMDTENWFMQGETASTAENLAGLHADHQLVLLDEASGIKEFLFPTLFGAVSTGAIQILAMIGNPTKNSGTFAHSHLRQSVAKDFWRIKITLDKAPRVDRRWVAAMVRKYGEDSPIVKIRCFGEFAQAGENQLITPEWLARARERGDDPAVLKGDGSIGRLRVSIDVADGGEDKTVITVMRHFDTMRILLKQKTYSFSQGSAATKGADEAELLFTQYGGTKGQDDLVVDSLGVGSGLGGVLIERGHSVVLYKGGEASSNQKLWRNRRVQSYMVLRNDLRDNRLVILDSAMDEDETIKEDDEFVDPWDEFDAQLCSIKTNPNTDRVEDLMTKQQMKDDGLTSPDRADSLAMQYATQAPTLNVAPEAVVEALASSVAKSDFFGGYVG